MPEVKMEASQEDDDYNLQNLNFNEDDDEDDEELEDVEEYVEESPMGAVIMANVDTGSSGLSGSTLVNLGNGSTPESRPKIPIMKDGIATCIRCGNMGVKDTFYGKGKQYCSGNCVRGLPPQGSRPGPVFKLTNSSSINANSAATLVSGSASSTMSSSSSIAPQTIVTITTSITGTPGSVVLTPASAEALRRVAADLVSAPGSTKAPLTTLGRLSGAGVALTSTGKTIPIKSGKSIFKSPTKSIKINDLKPASVNSPKSTQGANKQLLSNSFDWTNLLNDNPTLVAAPVTCFKYAPLADSWNSLVTIGLKVEVKNKDYQIPGNNKLNQDFYWIASVVKIAGYFVLLRYEGYGNDSSKDFWVNIYTTHVHPVGWCASQGKVLTPPKSVEAKHADWKGFLVKRLTGSRTLPENFYDQLKDHMKSRFQVGLKLEVVDKKRISAVRVARIEKIIGERLHVKYEGTDDDTTGFWCHQESTLIHPVGWAQLVGHELKSTHEYAKRSSEKAITKNYDPDEAHWGLFAPTKSLPQLPNPDHKFKEGMKLEAIDPLNLSTICVATVTKVLRHNYLMIGIDGMMAQDGSDWFCYHATSPCIFPVGFCMLNKLELTPPRGYDKEFKWFQYLKECKAVAAPVPLFKKDIPNHGFAEGMYLEAVDLMEPRLVCVAQITKVVGRLIKVNFIGWDESYDQWCDCESPELFPVGWCQMAGYPLEPPRDDENGDYINTSYSSGDASSTAAKLGRKRSTYKGRYKRKRKYGSSTNGILTEEKQRQATASPSSNTHVFNANNNGEEKTPSHWTRSSSPSRSVTSNSSVVVKPSPISPMTTEPGKLSSLPKDPKEWSTAQVSAFLRINECGAYCNAFNTKKVDGNKLLRLSREDILEMTGYKVGPSLKIHAMIQQLNAGK